MLAIVAAVMLAAASQHDTVFTSDGGRVVGTVVEEGPRGIAVQLLDGTYRRFARRDVVRIEYADGSVSKPVEPPPSPPAAPQPPPTYAPAPPPYTPPPPPQGYPPPPAYPRPPSYAPPPPGYPPPPPYPAHPPPSASDPRASGGPISPVYLTFGLGGAFFSGEAERNLDMDRFFSSQLNLSLEGGLRLTPHLALALYGDVGVGEPGRETREFCSLNGLDCTATTGRLGLLLRVTLEPAARATPWLAVGTGFEFGNISADDGVYDDLLTYTGWEALRLMTGVDFRSNRALGIGFYAGVAFGRYNHVEDRFGVLAIDEDLGRQPFHTTVEGGIRFTLFP